LPSINLLRALLLAVLVELKKKFWQQQQQGIWKTHREQREYELDFDFDSGRNICAYICMWER